MIDARSQNNNLNSWPFDPSNPILETNKKRIGGEPIGDLP